MFLFNYQLSVLQEYNQFKAIYECICIFLKTNFIK